LYEFVDQKLAATAYDFEFTRKEEFSLNMRSWGRRWLTGMALRGEMPWFGRAPQFRDRPRDYGLAIWLEHARCETSWETAETQILLYLSNGPTGVNASVTYVSKALGKAPEERGQADRWVGLF
jgi:hypothetical protein